MNADLCRKALEKVGDARILVNLVSRRVRQLNSGGGYGRALVNADPAAGACDVALQEIVEDKITWEAVVTEASEPEAIPVPKRRRKSTAAPAAAA